jgi:hypothetical protein
MAPKTCRSGRVLSEKIGRRGWDDGDGKSFEHVMAGELYGKVAREPRDAATAGIERCENNQRGIEM